MALDFATLKKSRKSSLESLKTEAEKLTQRQDYGDDRLWKPTIDKAGNGYAVIRFLPAPKGEDLPWVKIYDHGFQGPGGWFIDTCRTTIKGECPVCEENNKLWNSGIEANKDVARKRKRRLKYYSNILVVSDKENPENEGKVFLFQFGAKIFEKLQNVMQPEFEDETPLNPFDFWEGANFKLKIRNVEGYRNYDKSEFDSASEISDDDKELERIWESQHSLTEFVNPENFKSYDDQLSRLNRVLGLEEANQQRSNYDDDEDEVQEPVKAKAAKPKEEEKAPWNGDDEDDDMSYFSKLANED